MISRFLILSDVKTVIEENLNENFAITLKQMRD